MFHIDDSEVYLTSVISDDVSKDPNGSDVLCTEGVSGSPLVSYLKRVTAENSKVSMNHSFALKMEF